MRRVLAVLVLLFPVALSSQSRLPTPESVLGFVPGSDHKLATYDQTVDYFRKLDAASDRVQLVEAGKTTQGRTFYFALISSRENLQRLDRYRQIAVRLAHPEGLTDDQARQLAREGKAFVHIDGGLHADEFAGPQHTPLLAYDLLTHADEPEYKPILDNVILMLWPTINPDGQQMVAEWHMQNVGTPQENQGLPRLYQEYVGHDNNRDAYMLDMIESRVLEYTWRQWEPEIIHVHHQGAPAPSRIWFPPFAEPIATDAPPIISREINMLGMAMARREDEDGHPGTMHMGTGYDAWYPGYIDYNPIFKNIAAYWTETAPTPLAPRNAPVRDNQLRPESLYASPWPGGDWSLALGVRYMESASMGALEFAAKYKESVLYDRYLAGRNQIALGEHEAPYAYIVPQDQRDPVAAVELLRRLAFSGVRVSQLTADVKIGDDTWPAGTWVVPTDQEFAAAAREVLDEQHYPQVPGSDGTLDQPYDAAGWTLPISMNVRVVPAGAPLGQDARAKMKRLGPTVDPAATPKPYPSSATDAAPFDSVPGVGFDANPAAAAIVPPAGHVTGSGSMLAIDPAQNNAFRAINRAWKAGLEVRWEPASGSTGARYLIGGLSERDQQELVSSLALAAERTDAPGTAIKRPRIGLFHPQNSIDEGWTRWVLEQYGFDYTSVTGDDIEAGGLRDKLDVLLIGDESRGVLAGGGRGGRGGGFGGGAPGAPGAARAGGAGAGAGGARGGGAAGARGGGAAGGRAGGSAAAGRAGGGAAGQTGGAVGGGRGGGRGGGAAANSPANEARIRALDEFIRAGGTLVCLNDSTVFAIDQLDLPVRNALAGLSRRDFFAGISLLRVNVDPTLRVMAGMPQEAAVFFDGSPAFEPLEGFKGEVLARYADTGSPLASGYLLGEDYLHGKAAAVDVDHGDGHVVLIGFRPQWRGQPFGTFRVMFNAVLAAR